MKSHPARHLVSLARCGACACLCAGLAPPQAVRQIVPAGTEKVDGSSVEPFLLGGFEGRTQLVIDRTKLGALATKAIRRIILRRDVQTNDSLPGGMKGGWIDLVVVASWSRANPRNPSPWFPANHGKGAAVVYRGPYRVIDSPRLPAATKVASLAPTVSAHVVLQAPIQPSSSGNLCLELRYRRHKTLPLPAVWLVDAVEVQQPPTRLLGRSCWRKGKQDPASANILSSAAVGASMTCTTRGPRNAFGFLAIGASDRLWGLLKLPFDLTAYGAQGCLLYVSQDLRLPARLQVLPNVAFTIATAELQIPLDARLVGSMVHSQWVFYQPGANALDLTMTNAASIVLPAAPPSLGVGMVRSLDPSSSFGRVFVNKAPVLVLAAQ